MVQNSDDKQRYERQMLLEEIGTAGQEKLRQARVCIVGVGGLGSSVSLYLAAAGVGSLGLVDYDIVAISNLQRQVLYRTTDIGEKKVLCAKERLVALNPGVSITAYDERLNAENVCDVIQQYDIIVDATDTLDAKFMLNDTCCKARIPLVHAGVTGFSGQVMTIVPNTACVRCLMPQIPDDIYQGKAKPVFGVIAGIVGQIQASEVLKYLVGTGDLLINAVMFVNILNNRFNTVPVLKRAGCIVCSDKAGM